MGDSFETGENLFISDADPQEAPDFSDLFDDDGTGSATSDPEEHFERVSELTTDPQPYFKNPNYYQDLLNGEGEISKRLHATLAGFLKATEAEDKSVYRSRLIPVYWELARSITKRVHGGLSDPKLLFLRFGIVLPTILDKEQRVLFAQIPRENRIDQPIFYADEWLDQVATGKVGASSTDETKPGGKTEVSKVSRQMETARGRLDAQLDLLKTRNREMEGEEAALQQIVTELTRREPRIEANNQSGPYSESQRASFAEINAILRRLSNMNRELSRAFNDLEKYQDAFDELKEQAKEIGEDVTAVDTGAAVEEMGTIQQMAKLAVGRQGNHFPIFSRQYFRSGLSGIATRENVNNVLADAERLDPSIFHRTFKQKTTRIVPNVILIPCYGDYGICWEPFERFNRASSRGRLAVPMYPKDLKVAIIAALGDLRWQVAKEKAAHYWMEEGLTGWYYQWFTEQKLKGDVKDQFNQDYILWLTKESEGTQKLDRDVRGIFWRYMPFPQDVKEMLKNRGFVYQELYKKDQNRAMSDGY